MTLFRQIEAELAFWPEIPSSGDSVDEYPDRPHLRTHHMLQDARQHPSRVGPRDIASLLRHSLRYEEAAYSDNYELVVPTEATNPFPNPEIWQEHGLTVHPEGGKYRLQVTKWTHPAWLRAIHCNPRSESEPVGPRRDVRGEGVRRARDRGRRLPAS